VHCALQLRQLEVVDAAHRAFACVVATAELAQYEPPGFVRK
jgi:hypothetical protein